MTNSKKTLPNWAVALFWLLLWQMGSKKINQDLLFASPVSVFFTLKDLIQTKDFWLSIGSSLGKIALGFFLAFFSGIFIGIVSYFMKPLKELLQPFLSFMKAIPIASFIVLALVWMSSENLSVLISFFVVFPMIYLGVMEGFANTDKEMLEMAFVYQISLFRKIWYLYLPESIPFFIQSSKIALGMCWKAGIAAEIIGTPKNSIGEHLYMAKIYLSTSELFAWTFVIIILSMLFEKAVMKLFGLFQKRLGAGHDYDKKSAKKL